MDVTNWIPFAILFATMLGMWWKITSQYADLVSKIANMATKEEIKAMDDRITRLEDHMNAQFAEIRSDIKELNRAYISHLEKYHSPVS